MKRVRRISPGDRPIVAAGGVLMAITTLLAFYLALGRAGPIILAFSFWGPLLPLRYLGWKFVHPYLNRHPARMPAVSTLLAEYILAFIATVTLSILARPWLMRWQWRLPRTVAWLGFPLLTVTFLIWYAMTRQLGWKFRTVGMAEMERRGAPLVTGGIYAYTRHPEYLSEPICLLGLLLLTGTPSLLLLLLLWVLFIYPVMTLEERHLVARYGVQYRRYQRRTPQLIPRRPSMGRTVAEKRY